jgi:hypothetical protein
LSPRRRSIAAILVDRCRSPDLQRRSWSIAAVRPICGGDPARSVPFARSAAAILLDRCRFARSAAAILLDPGPLGRSTTAILLDRCHAIVP